MGHFLKAPNETLTPAWLDALPDRDRAVLRQLGIAPDAHPRAAEYNQRLLEAARRCFEEEELSKAATLLHIEVFGGDATAIARVLDALANNVRNIGHLGYVVIQPDGSVRVAGVGRFNPLFVLQAIEAAADMLDGLDITPVGPVPAQPMETWPYRRKIGHALAGLAESNDRGEVAGLATVACGPAGASFHVAGAVPPRPAARSLRQLRDAIERESRVRRPKPDQLRAWFTGEGD